METSIYFKCLRCGKPLKTIGARKRGYGFVCWQQYRKEMLQSTDLLKIHTTDKNN